MLGDGTPTIGANEIIYTFNSALILQ